LEARLSCIVLLFWWANNSKSGIHSPHVMWVFRSRRPSKEPKEDSGISKDLTPSLFFPD
jgi:hypothetical protein